MEEHPEIPGPAYTRNNGFSNGTANGVYTFLENQLGVRWLMPGDYLGRDVPTRNSFEVAEMDHTEAPEMISRKMTSLSSGAAVGKWRVHQKLGYSFNITYGHAWDTIVPPSMYDKHPDWFAMNSAGKRPRPAPGSHYYKLESTNPEVVRYFADEAIKTLKANPQMNTIALSPSDGWNWSQSPESKAWFDPPAPGTNVPSVTPLVLKFYREVSEIVAREYPEGKLAGYIYSNFSYPPQKGGMKLPDNFIPVITDYGHGFRYYNPEHRKTAAYLVGSWEKVAPATWFYYCLSNWIHQSTGIVQPASPDNLNFLFQDIMLKNRISGVQMYGMYSWSQAAMSNYVNAKMLWNPRQDARVVQRDWLFRAYGPKAGAVMEELYNKMDGGWFRPVGYQMTEANLEKIYGAHYQGMEKLFLEAEKQTMTDVQRKRLNLIKNNFIILQWRLRNAGHLPKDFTSPLTRSHEQVETLLVSEENRSTPVSKNSSQPAFYNWVATLTAQTKRPTAVKVQLGDVPNEPAKPVVDKPVKAQATPNTDFVLLYPTRDGEINIKAGDVLPGSSFLSYAVREGSGRAFESGILYPGKTISFKAGANKPYYFNVAASGLREPIRTNWAISVADAKPAQGRFQNGTLTLQGPPAASLYVYVPAETPLSSEADATGVVVQTESPAAARSRAVQKMQQQAQDALEAALNRYPEASLMRSLDTLWRFKTDPEKTGVKQGFIEPDFDDRSWRPISTIGSWQTNGYEYHGTAWYRKTFTPPEAAHDALGMDENRLLLFFGAIDGDAVIYLNGEKIGERIMADYDTAWEMPFSIDVTNSLAAGENTIAVQVTKDNYAAGIYRGVSLLSAAAVKK